MDDKDLGILSPNMVYVMCYPTGPDLWMRRDELDIPEEVKAGTEVWLAPAGALAAAGVKVVRAVTGHRVELEWEADQLRLRTGNDTRFHAVIDKGVVLSGTVVEMR